MKCISNQPSDTISSVRQLIVQKKLQGQFLTIMVCPLMGGPSFVARISQIYSINHDILCDAINKVIAVIQKLRCIDPDSGETVIASFKHIKEIYEGKKELTTKQTSLDFATIYPTNLKTKGAFIYECFQ